MSKPDPYKHARPWAELQALVEEALASFPPAPTSPAHDDETVRAEQGYEISPLFHWQQTRQWLPMAPVIDCRVKERLQGAQHFCYVMFMSLRDIPTPLVPIEANSELTWMWLTGNLVSHLRRMRHD